MSDTPSLRQAALDYHAHPKPGKLGTLTSVNEPKVDIVFVHGVTGDPFGTWLQGKKTSPKMLDEYYLDENGNEKNININYNNINESNSELNVKETDGSGDAISDGTQEKITPRQQSTSELQDSTSS